MGCLLGILGAFFPRLAVLLIWLARPVLFTSAFGGAWLLPILGIIFLPFTTLIYVLLWTPLGLPPLSWLWLLLAVLLDLGTWGSTAYNNRSYYPRRRT